VSRRLTDARTKLRTLPPKLDETKGSVVLPLDDGRMLMSRGRVFQLNPHTMP
jgi:hypothetical protein